MIQTVKQHFEDLIKFQNGEFLTAASLITPGIVLTAGTKTFKYICLFLSGHVPTLVNQWTILKTIYARKL